MRGPCAYPGSLLAARMASRTGTRPLPIPTSAPCPYRTVLGALPILLVNVHHRAATKNDIHITFLKLITSYAAAAALTRL
jgi:hypothetical protein